jgi:geranylgeranyl diphosphate synthase type II
MSFALKAYLEKRRQAVEAELKQLLHADDASPRIVQAMSYSLMAGGKRLRPILCLAACEALGGNPNHALSTGCAIEMIHTYSLIHDDLPAMDNDTLRRGKPTCHVAFDEATAILAGDALLTLAFGVIAHIKPQQDGFSAPSPAVRLRMIHLLSDAAGIGGMIEGQMQDMLSEGAPSSLEALERMHRLKTGAMIEASVACGVLAGGGGENDVSAFRRYGHHIGLAFQIQDDILNVEGDPQIMGKAVGTDQMRRKTTYPSLVGLENARTMAKAHRDEAIEALERYDEKADPLRALADYIIHRNR